MVEPYPREQAQSFGQDPANYDRFRPSYPRQLMEAVVADTGRLPVLEIGAGTGKATRALQALGKTVHALEPDARMASVLELNCGGDNLHVIAKGLESVQLPEAGYDLVLAAQAWHWLDAELAYDVVADALVPDGVLALIWHHPLPNQGLFGSALRHLYARVAPDITEPLPGAKAISFDPTTEPFAATKRFRSWARMEHRWQRRLDAANLIGWLCSGSEHRMLPLEQRTDLMAAVVALVCDLGDDVVINMTTVAHLAYRV